MSTDRPGSASASQREDVRDVVAWDAPTRLFHWTLAVLVALAWVSRKYGDTGLVWHTWNGYAILTLVTWRILWGFVGSSTARFSSFFSWPGDAARYGIDFMLRRPRHYLGHNPLGGMVVLLMLGLIGLQGILGLFSYDDSDSNAGGPLASKVSDETWAWATKWHLQVFDVLLVVIGIHGAASILYLVWRRENLVKAMVTGRKPAAPFEDMSQATVVGAGRALACLGVAAALVLGGIRLAGGRLF